MILGEDRFGEVPFGKNNLRRVCTAITLIFRVILADNHVSPEEMSEAIKLLNVWLEVPELMAGNPELHISIRRNPELKAHPVM